MFPFFWVDVLMLILSREEFYLHGTKEQWRHTLEYDKLVSELHHTKTGS